MPESNMQTRPIGREEAVKHMYRGKILDNVDVQGATVIDFEWDDRYFDGSVNPGGVLIAIRVPAWAIGEAHYNEPYVTWSFVLREDATMLCVQGHYFDQLEPAVNDFLQRKPKNKVWE